MYAVFGSPVLHSKSPQLFRSMLRDKDFYTRILPQSAEDILRIVKLLNLTGASITSPFKLSLLPLLDDLTPSARSVGAVNCIRHENGGVFGHNTDFMGVIVALEESGMFLRHAKILVLGAGGAARAAVYGLKKAGSEVYVCNRTQAKAKELAATFGANFIDWENQKTMPFFDAVVSTLLPEAIPPFAGRLTYGKLLDAVYKPSKMSDFSRSRGITVITGDRWLIYQGLAAADFYVNKDTSLSHLQIERPETVNQHFKAHSSRGNGAPEPQQDKALPKKMLTGNDMNAPRKMPLIKRLEEALSHGLQQDNVRSLVLNEQTATRAFETHYDLMVSGFGLSEEAVKKIIDEEKHLAFSG